MGQRDRGVSHATVVAYLGLFVAVATGGAYAAEKIGSKQIEDDAVKSRHVADDAIRNRHIRPGNVTGESVAQGTILGSNVAANALTGENIDESTLNLPPGPQGEKGDTGSQGPIGPQGPPGADAASFLTARIGTIDSGARCGFVSGQSNATPSCSGPREMISPPHAIVATGISARLYFAAPSSAEIDVSFEAPSPTALSCTIPAGSANGTCNAETDIPIAPESRMQLRVTDNRAGGESDPADAIAITTSFEDA